MINLYIFNKLSRAAIYGIGTYIRELTNALKHSNINVCVVQLYSDKQDMLIEEEHGITYWYIPEPAEQAVTIDSNKQNELYYKNVIYLLKLYIPDFRNLIFHLNHPHNYSLADAFKSTFDCRVLSVVHYSDWALTLLGNLAQLQVILTKETEECDPLEQEVHSSIKIEQQLFSVVDKIVCLSQCACEILQSVYQIDKHKISVIPNGLMDVCPTIFSENIKLRAKWNLPIEEKLILSAGRLNEEKGLTFLIRAFREVLQKIPECRLIIAGNGNFDKYMKEAKDICMKITFTGQLEKEELYELYSIADIGVVPSLFETFGYVAVEMMMHRLPIIATATSGLDELLEDGISALKVPVIEYPDRVEIDSSLLAQKILHLLNNTDEAQRLGNNARQRYLEKYAAPVFRKNMIKFYKSLYTYPEL